MIRKSALCIGLLSFITSFALAQSKYLDYGDHDREVILFEDFLADFGNFHVGPMGQDNCTSAKILNGQYEIEEHCESSFVYFFPAKAQINERRDFEIELAIQIGQEAVPEEDSHNIWGGLTWGLNKDDPNVWKYYQLTIDKLNRLNISRNDGKWFSYFPTQAVNQIRAYGFNKVTIRKVKEKYYYFINETLVHTDVFEPFFGYTVGFELNSVRMRVEFVRIAYLSVPGEVTANTARDTSTPGKAETIFFEDFLADYGTFPVGPFGDNNCSNAKIENGYYELAEGCDVATLYYFPESVKLDVNRNFEVETAFQFLAGEETKANELFWGYDKQTSYGYVYSFSKSGSANIGKYDGKWYYSYPWATQGNYKRSSFNKILLRKIDDQYSFYYNDQLIHTSKVDPFYGESIGIRVDKVTLRVEYFKVSYLPVIKPETKLANNNVKPEVKKEEIVPELPPEKRLALVIGNANYGDTKTLRNPVNDADLIAKTLEGLGFEVIKRTNATKLMMERSIREFSDKLPDYNITLFYYAGHGMQVDGVNYLIPTDALMEKKEHCRFEAININLVSELFDSYPGNTNILILDACRNNPFRSWARGDEGGFKAMAPASGTIISFATSEGNTASDGPGNNGLFTEELVKQMTKVQSIESVFKKTRVEVEKRSGSAQSPQEWSKLKGDFWFKRP